MSWLPPTAKIQLPILVRSSTQVAIAVNTSQHTTVILKLTPPRVNSEAKTCLAWSKPSMSAIESDATFPVKIFVTARLTPCSIKNDASVTRKLGSLVLISR